MVECPFCYTENSDTNIYCTNTLAGLLLSEEDVIAFNIGDSRVYRYRPPYMEQLSADHTIDAEWEKWV